MKISYENLELYESVTFLCLGLGETKITHGKDDETLDFIFDFQKTDDGKQRLNFKAVNKTTFKAELINWNSTLGTTLMKPLEGAEIFGRDFFLIFSVKKLGIEGEIREITITTYLGQEIKNGPD